MNDLSRRRDPRIDFFRGLALVMIFINHIPDTVAGLYTSRNFGFSDAAEGFVLLSGISAGLAYSPIRSANRGLIAAFRPWRRAFTLWWVQALIVLSIYLLLRLALPLPGVAEMAAARNVTPVLDDPAGFLAPLLLLTHQFNCADILPLYIVLLLAAPGLIAAAWRWPAALLAGSGLLWLVAGWQGVNLRTWPQGNGWFFNPLAWQFLFSIGLVIGLASSKGRKPGALRTVAMLPAVALLVVSLLWMQSPALADRGQELLARAQEVFGLPDFATSLDKTFLAPLRLLHILALTLVLASLPVVTRIAHSPWAAPLTILGRNALPTFAAASILGYVIQVVREFFIPSDLLDAVVIALGLNAMLLVALLRDRQRHPARRPGAVVSG
jgi:hypothetical protein